MMKHHVEAEDLHGAPYKSGIGNTHFTGVVRLPMRCHRFG